MQNVVASNSFLALKRHFITNVTFCEIHGALLNKYFIFLSACVLTLVQSSLAYAIDECDLWRNWFKPVCIKQRTYKLWTEGHNELYLTGYAWHNRYTYSKERLDTYNELAWGGGLGKGYYDSKGNWHGLYAFAFLDSHKNIEPIAGYAYLKVFHLSDDFNVGGGVTVFVTARPDLFHGNPFPGALPALSISFHRFSLGALYIPGAVGAGNVLFLLGKYRF